MTDSEANIGAYANLPDAATTPSKARRSPGDLPATAAPESVGLGSWIRIRGTRWLRPVLLAALFAVVAELYVALAWARTPRQMDLHIYREAMAFAANGNFLYDYVYQYVRDGVLQTLGFTYPPFAALLLRPLGSLPEVPTQAVWLAATFAGLILLSVALVLGLHKEGRQPRPNFRDAGTWTVVLQFAVALLLSAPMLGHVLVGQVSLALVLLVYVDLALVPTRWRGALTGIAAAVKLTPLLLIGYLVLARQWRAGAQAAITFVACSVLGWLILPRESAAYWGFWLWQTSRVGDPAMEDNKSLLGLLSRAAGTGEPRTVVWLVAVAIVAVVGLRHAIKLSRAGLLSSGALVAGCVSLAVSPISWPHHQFWVLLLALTAVVCESRRWRMWGAAILVLFNVCLILVTFVPEGPLTPFTEIPVLGITACCLLGLPGHSASPTRGTDPLAKVFQPDELPLGRRARRR